MTSPAATGTENGITREHLDSNNPFRQREIVQPEEANPRHEKEQQQSLDSEKQVVSAEQQSGPDSAPMVVDSDTSPEPKIQPVREADKEVTSSWQSKSREESAPIPMDYHESRIPQGNLLDDNKGPPPAYDSINGQSRSGSDDMLTTPNFIEPDDSGLNLAPRPEDRTTVGQLLSWVPSAPRIPKSRMPPLFQPVVIPQLDVPPQGESVPFSRCYSDVLASHDVPMRDFISFLDGLALAQAPNSALQGLKMFGAGVSSIPLPLIPLAGKGISALATSGSGHSGSRARLYLERAKKEYFAPRGLRLSILKDNDLNARLQVPTHAPKLAPLTKNTLTDNLCRRRLEALAPYVAPLRFDVPEQDQQTQGVHKLARKHLDSKFKGANKTITRLREQQWQNISSTRIDVSGWERKYTAKMAEIRKLQLDLVREQQQLDPSGESSTALKEGIVAVRQTQRELQSLVSERQMSTEHAAGGTRGVEAEMEEVNLSRKLKWIVIEGLQ